MLVGNEDTAISITGREISDSQPKQIGTLRYAHVCANMEHTGED